MSRIPDYTHNVSLRMSQVMDVIGVNEKIVIKRRKSYLLIESLSTLTYLQHSDVYCFGSQTEGTTTLGLNSDTDFLIAMNKFNVIQDWSEWEHGKLNLLMIQNETVSPGYYMLQVLRNDAPLPEVNEVNQHSFRDGMGRILLKNTFIDFAGNDEHVRHGPAHSQQGISGIFDNDYVYALPCQSYPIQARQWLDQHREEYWLSNDIIQYCHNTGCFVVAVGNKGSENVELEWRISTSLAERCLMFNLNITQIRCYVLMKMILKKYIPSQYPENISSFMCKTVLLHCISNTETDKWMESKLLNCLSFCLSTLYNGVLNEYCPHFLIPENNLMMRRFSQEHKPDILEVLYYVIQSNGRALLEIECDRFGQRLQLSLNGDIARNANISTLIAGQLLNNTALNINESIKYLLCTMKDLSSGNAIRMMTSIMTKFNNTQHIHIESKYLIAQQLCLTFGSILTSSSIYRRDNLLYKSFSFMLLGLNCDVAYGKLKLASVFYSIGDIERSGMILKYIEECYDLSVVEPICNCYNFQQAPTRERFRIFCYDSIQECKLLKHITASCVKFLQCEVNCCPYELRHEMFRSTQEDFLCRGKEDDWMDMAVVDCLPFLYFLQYKTYSRLGKVEDKDRSLLNLMRTIDREPNLGHRETALNLLGQCMETEQRKDNALKIYMLSLKIRKRNNAAKFLICRLICNVINGRER